MRNLKFEDGENLRKTKTKRRDSMKNKENISNVVTSWFEHDADSKNLFENFDDDFIEKIVTEAMCD